MASFGWRIPQLNEHGVYEKSVLPIDGISYPESGFDLLSLESGYWFEHRAKAIISKLQIHGVRSIWDVGAGTGSVAVQMASVGIDVVAVEPILPAAISAAESGLTVIRGSLESLQLPDASIESVGLFDVLEHLPEPDDLISEVARVVRLNGLLVVTVPAFQFLWSDEDDVSGHFRRYGRKRLISDLERLGFQAMSVEYLFASLVPIASIARALPYSLGRRRSEEQVFRDMGQQLRPNIQLEKAARMVLAAEVSLTRYLRLPFGLSLFGVFRRVE